MKFDPDKYYSLSDLARLRLLPVNNNRENLAKLVEKDIEGPNIMKAYRKEWKIKGKYTYRVQGHRYLNYIALRGYDL